MSYRQKLTGLLRKGEVFPGELEGIQRITNTPGCDINEHIPTLIEYGMCSRTITEMGVRFGFSTRAFLYALPDSLHSIDKFEWNSREHAGADQRSGNHWYKFYKDAYKDEVEFTYELADTTHIDPIPETDLLFIDTFHHKYVLEIELEKHGNQADKFIIMHDTDTFGQFGQADNSLLFVDKATTNGSETGLWYAINPFLEKNPQWRVAEHYTNNNGLTVLARTHS